MMLKAFSSVLSPRSLEELTAAWPLSNESTFADVGPTEAEKGGLEDAGGKTRTALPGSRAAGP